MVTSECIVLHDNLFSCSSDNFFGNYHVMGQGKVLRRYKFRCCQMKRAHNRMKRAHNRMKRARNQMRRAHNQMKRAHNRMKRA